MKIMYGTIRGVSVSVGILNILLTCFISVNTAVSGPTDCKNTAAGTEYVGTQNSVGNVTCIRWDSVTGTQIKFPDSDFPDGSAAAAQNYCRNPNNDATGPWCYTNFGPNGNFVNCNNILFCCSAVPQPVNTNEGASLTGTTNCKYTEAGTEYNGTMNSVGNITCLRWDNVTAIQIRFSDDHFPDGSTAAAQNYCRTPDGDQKGPWCYTDNPDPNNNYIYCPVPFCCISPTTTGSAVTTASMTQLVTKTQTGASSESNPGVLETGGMEMTTENLTQNPNSESNSEASTVGQMSSESQGEASVSQLGSTVSQGGSIISEGGSTISQAGSTVSQGGSTVSQGGSTVSQGGSVVSQGGSTVSQGGSTVSQGGSTVSQGGSTVSQGGSTVSQGGSTVSQGGSTVSQGGSTVSQGGSTVSQGGSTVSQGGSTVSQGGSTVSQEASVGSTSQGSGSETTKSSSTSGGRLWRSVVAGVVTGGLLLFIILCAGCCSWTRPAAAASDRKLILIDSSDNLDSTQRTSRMEYKSIYYVTPQQ